MHRDLKPENIMLEENKHFDSIKIIDFGTSVQFKPNEHIHERLGTPYYIAPEVLNGDYGPKADIWSTGVIVYIMMTGCPPFNGEDDDAIMERIKTGKFKFHASQWKGMTKESQEFISHLLVKDPAKRPTAEEALQHPWLDH